MTAGCAAPVFRQADSADIPAMSAIRLAVLENVLRDPSRVTPAMYQDYLGPRGRGWVAELAGEVAAFCYADKQDGSIWALFVDPRHEGPGLARRLLAMAVDWLFALGHERVCLTTGAGTRAARFYAAQGWQCEQVGETELRYCLRKDDGSAYR